MMSGGFTGNGLGLFEKGNSNYRLSEVIFIRIFFISFIIVNCKVASFYLVSVT